MADPVTPNLTTYDGEAARDMLPTVRQIYAEAYAEPPYNEGPEDVAEFADAWPWYIERPGFRLVVAELDGAPVGFTFGFQLTPETGWWDGFLDPVDVETAREWDGRTFAIIELAVAGQHRHRGIAHHLHEALLSDRPERRVTLTVRPEAEAVTAMYRHWGYEAVGRRRPGPTKPVYVTMLRDLHHARVDEDIRPLPGGRRRLT